MAELRKTVLVVDDEETAREQLVSALRRDYRVLRAASGEAAIPLLEGEDVNVMLLDMTLPGIGGFDVLNITKENYPFIEVVAVVSDVQELTIAIEAIRQGAFHYWAKGQPADAIRPLVASACERQSLNRSVQRLNAEVAEGDKEFIAGPSKATREVLDLVRKVARLPATVLILGESGTGKELLARMLHHEGGDLSAIQEVRARGDLKHRVSYEASGRVLDSMMASGIRSGFGDEWIKFGATSEHTVDGSFSERTMALSIPYPGVQPPYKGNVTETQDDLNAWVERVHRAGIQVNCHANGDVAIDMYLTAFERAQKAFPRPDARPKITHCTLINDDLVRRIKAAGAVPAMFTTYAYYNTDKFPFYGEELMKRSMAYRTLLDAGIVATAGSDFSPGPFAPLMGMQGMVTRKGWDGTTWGLNQRITVDEALKVNTINGAYASHEESLKGSITAGKLADFVVLADDPHTVNAEKIKDIQIVRTVVGGATVYQA